MYIVVSFFFILCTINFISLYKNRYHSKCFSYFSAGVCDVDINWERLADVRLVGVCSMSFRGEVRKILVLLD